MVAGRHGRGGEERAKGKGKRAKGKGRREKLVDSGNPGDRDVNRVMDVLKDAGVSRLDSLVSTHYHIDHIGGMQALAGRIPIAHSVDHGPSVEPKEQVPGFQAATGYFTGEKSSAFM
jgi:beta-lactamase superfamily II metal-dependent hydrolase